jgi:hypothetical protein
MFGSGMSATDKMILSQGEQMLAALAIAGADVKRIVRRLFDETKAESPHQDPQVMYRDDLGDRIIENEQFFRPRKEAGLTENDIRAYWNRPSLLVSLETKIQYFVNWTMLDMARQQGKDLIEFARDNRRRNPKYGAPESWDQSLPMNEVFTSEDADLYPEFIPRIGLWQERTPIVEQERLLAGYSSFNAMTRDLVRRGKI